MEKCGSKKKDEREREEERRTHGLRRIYRDVFRVIGATICSHMIYGANDMRKRNRAMEYAHGCRMKEEKYVCPVTYRKNNTI